MKPDDELCLCFHVSWRKVINYIRVHRVRRASQLSDCGGAGTGCGWCRKQLTSLTETVGSNPPAPEHVEQWLAENSPAKVAYAENRRKYIAEGKGRPPAGSEPPSAQLTENDSAVPPLNE